MPVQHLAMITVHASPLASLGSGKAGGMNVYVRELAQELGRCGIRVDIFTRSSSDEAVEVDGSLGENVRVVHILAGPQATLSPEDVYPYLAEFVTGVTRFGTVQNTRYDLIYSHYWLSGMVAHQLKAVWSIPFVQMFHTLGQMKNRIVAGYNPSHAADIRVNGEAHIVRWTNRIVAATPAEQAQLLWLYRADRRKIVIIPPGVNAERFYPVSSEAAKASLGYTPNVRLLLFAGRIEPLKAVDIILQALYLLKQRSPQIVESVRLIVVGGNANDPADAEVVTLRQMSRQLEVDAMVDFVGAQRQDVLPCYYAAAEALIMPSDYESFGMVALEAMASGTPVIASEVGGLAFLVRHGESGYLMPSRDPGALADRIMWLLENPERRSQMGQTAYEIARQYTWPRIAEQLIQVFNGLIDHPPSTLTRRRS